MLDRFFKITGVASLGIFGGLFILTLLAPVPAFKFWLTGAALFQAIAFLFASVVGVMGLRNHIPKWHYRGLLIAAILLSGFAWWQAAEQAATQEEIRGRISGSVQPIGNLEEKTLEDGTWVTKRKFHIQGAVAQSGVVLRFYGAKVKSFKVNLVAGSLEKDEPYSEEGTHYAHYLLRPTGLFEASIKFREKAPIEFTYRFEDGRPESKRILWAKGE